MTSQFDPRACPQPPGAVAINCDGETKEWLSVAAFAKLHGVTRQAITQALSRCAKGLSWRGGIIIRKVHQGRGGNTFHHGLLPVTNSVVCAIPFRKGVRPLFELGPDDWVSLEIEDMFHPLDPAGAAESSGRQRDR